ncbi:MAG TPA: peptidyl-prolyl cis-trans isomerase [Gaiella sp.]|jgi:parvulin-like peptidyl-prolyl isomerase|nr:peptidyl-prolyl cis-trans isomerase [Gaiella sp.]
MKRSLMLAAAALAVLTVVAAGCGDTDEVPQDAVAVVDGTPISKSTLDGLLERTKKTYATQKRQFPKAGTQEYQALQTQAVAFLVQRQEYEREAEKLGVKITDAQIQKKVDDVKKQYFGGDQKKFEAGLKAQSYTLEALRDDARAQLASEGIYKDITSDVKVSDAEAQQYYDDNIDRYKVAESREVRHILVKTKDEADQLHDELVNGGANFTTLAKEKSLDPGSKEQGGKLTVSKGQTVEAFDKAAFSLDTNEISDPIKTQYGYHIIQPLTDVKPGRVTPFTEVRSQIKSQLLQQKKADAVSKWVSGVEKEYKGKVTYAAGFEPPDTTSTSTGTTSG